MMTLNIPGRGEITLENNNYTNCHEFTKAVILGLSRIQRLNNQWDEGKLTRLSATSQTADIINVYSDMLEATGNRLFDRNSINNVVNPPGLIIFKLGDDSISHSMIATDINQWQGANNHIALGEEDTEVHIYNDIDNREYVAHQTGGWDNAGRMRSYTTDTYTMYYIPL